MILPLINPYRKNAPPPVRPKYRMTKASKVYGPLTRGSILYRDGFPVLQESTAEVKRYFRELKSRKNPVKKRKKSPAIKSRGVHNPSKESGMSVYSLVPRRRRAIRRRRRNPRFGAHRPTLRYTSKGWKRGKRSRLMRRALMLRNPSFGKHRPVVMYTPTGWKRPRRSKLLKRHARINPRHSRYSRRRNPMPYQIDKVFIGGLKFAAGLAVGYIGMPVFSKVMNMVLKPDQALKARRFYGVFHIALGAVIAATAKNKNIKDAALIVAGTGVYDLIASNIPLLGLPPLPSENPLLAKIGFKGEEPGVIGASYQEVAADYQPAFGASYENVGEDDIAYGAESAYELD